MTYSSMRELSTVLFHLEGKNKSVKKFGKTYVFHILKLGFFFLMQSHDFLSQSHMTVLPDCLRFSSTMYVPSAGRSAGLSAALLLRVATVSLLRYITIAGMLS